MAEFSVEKRYQSGIDAYAGFVRDREERVNRIESMEGERKKYEDQMANQLSLAGISWGTAKGMVDDAWWAVRNPLDTTGNVYRLGKSVVGGGLETAVERTSAGVNNLVKTGASWGTKFWMDQFGLPEEFSKPVSKSIGGSLAETIAPKVDLPDVPYSGLEYTEGMESLGRELVAFTVTAAPFMNFDYC